MGKKKKRKKKLSADRKAELIIQGIIAATGVTIALIEIAKL
ncbi:hypothetical protein AGMMS49975_14030 [Clostridia bacterium]|nr:hypothetical protein AGMMS49975_14030 [Clostridia bacterium]GHU76415.1 hypothetical protein FACS1894188_08900 [Clostridia bacterium]